MPAGSANHATPLWPLASLLLLAMCLPMLVLYALGAIGPQLMQQWQLTPGQFGLLISASFGLAALLSPWAGSMVQASGARQALLTLFLCVAVAFSVLASARHYLTLLLALASCGVAQAWCNPATNLLIAQKIPARHKAWIVGFKQAGVQLAALLAGLLLQPLAARFGWQAVFAALVPLALLLAASVVKLLAKPAANHAPAPAANANRRQAIQTPGSNLQALMLLQGLSGLVLSSSVSFLPQFAQHMQMSANDGALLLALFGLCGLSSRVLLTPLAARLREESWLLIALALMASGALYLLTGAQSSWPLWLAAAMLGLSAVASNAIAMGMLLKDARFGPPAQAAGWLSFAFFGGFALGPLGFGTLLQLSNFSSCWQVLMACMLAGLMPAARLIYLRRYSASASAALPNRPL